MKKNDYMGFQLVSFIIMVLVFVSYVSFIWIKYGVQSSISASYYALPKQYNFLFTLFCWGFAIPAIIAGIDVTPLIFFAGAGICFVGAAAQINDSWIYKIHAAAAIAGVGFSQLAILFGYNMWHVNAISASLMILIGLLLKKNKTWWIELVAFSAIVYTIGASIF
jgi:hypothetical protein